MPLDVPPMALAPEAMGEYVYGNFPWPDIREWLLPQIAWARRIVILDGTDLGMPRQVLGDPRFPKDRVVGVWEAAHPSGEIGGVPFLADEKAIVAARPDLILSSLLPVNKTFPALTHLHVLTRAAIFPNLMLANPFSGSMMVWHGAGEPSNIFGPRFPPSLRESVVRHMGRYLLFSGWARDREVLDIACGNGYGTHLLSRVSRRVTGVDLNRHLVGFAERHNAASNVRYVCGDLVTLPREERFDLIASVETFEHVPAPDLDGFVAALKGFLKPGGTLLCTTPLARETVRNPLNREHVAEYSSADFTRALSAHVEVQGLLFQRHTGEVLQALPEGTPTPQSVDPAHIVQIAVATAR